MKITKTKIAEYFEWTMDYKFLSIVEKVLSLIEEDMNDDDIYETIDSEIIYYDDQWAILEFYCTPTKANFDEAYELFCSDIFAIVGGMKDENKLD